MKKYWIQSNEWYDNLTEPKRDLFFLIVVLGSLLGVQYLTYVHDVIWAFPIWAFVLWLYRFPYLLYTRKK